MHTIPKWGRVTAQPNEFLIQMRGATIVRAGQGQTCFKWPGDSVTLVPTSLAKLSFCADQVTREKVGVEVRGLAVYRIAEPLVAFRMIDLDRASLTEVLREMFVGATRRIVASLTLDEALTHRKDRVAAALMAEVAPILAGEGAPTDTNHAGWGVVLDTLEIQDVRVLSEEVFSRLQAPFREHLALDALVAESRVAEERARLASERQRAEEQTRRALMAEEEARLAHERRRAEEQRRHEDGLLDERQRAELARERARAEAELERASMALEGRRAEAVLEAEIVRRAREAHVDLSEARLRELMVTETVPEVARALRESFDRVNVTVTQGDALLAFLTSGVDRLLGLERRRPT